MPSWHVSGISDQPAIIGAGGYSLFYASGKGGAPAGARYRQHTSFTLQQEGCEYLSLYAPDGVTRLHEFRLLPEMDAAISAFQEQMQLLGVDNDVTLFSASDFGRTLTSNGRGSDHAQDSQLDPAARVVRLGDVVDELLNDVLTLEIIEHFKSLQRLIF